MYKLIHSKIIKKDIGSSHKYIKETLEAPMAADNLKKELLEKLEYIKEKPYSRPFVQDTFLASLGIRAINVKNFVIFYRIKEDEKNVTAVRFMYNKRDWKNILKENVLDGII